MTVANAVRAALLGILLLGAAPPPGDPIAARYMTALAPADFAFRGCVGLRVSRAFALTASGNKSIRIRNVRISSDDGAWGVIAPGKKFELAPGGSSAILTVSFEPKAAGPSPAKLRFQIATLKPNGTTDDVGTVEIDLSGTGVACAGDLPTYSAESLLGPVGTPPPDAAAGASEGTPPPATGPTAEIEVCVRFWALPDAGPLDAAKLDGWLGRANEIFRNSGIRFSRQPGPPGASAEVGKEVDPHCLDIYVGSGTMFPGDKAADTRVNDNPNWRNRIRGRGVADGFTDHSGIGDRICLENGDHAGDALAHELGHALGLGPAPDPDAHPQQHLDPSGAPITNGRRLMNPVGGEQLTDLERKIARLATEFLKGGPNSQGCELTRVEVPDPPKPPPPTPPETPRSDFRVERAISLQDRLAFEIVTAADWSRKKTPLSLRLEFDLDRDGRPERFVHHRWKEGSWTIEASPAEELDSPLLAPWSVWSTPPGGTAPRVEGLRVEIPKDLVGIDRGPISWRAILADEGLKGGERVSRGAWIPFDITPPRFVLDVAEAFRKTSVAAGGTLSLSGRALSSSTFSGRVSLALEVFTAEGLRRIPLGMLPSPLPAEWTARGTGEGLPAGTHPAVLRADCRRCNASTSLTLQVTVSAPASRWIPYGVVAILFAIALWSLRGIVRPRG